MDSLENVYLESRDHSVLLKDSLQDIRVNRELFDVTLASDDGEQIQAHKVILSACSPIFRRMLISNHHPHPLLFMRGLKSAELNEVLNFIYQGSVNIYHGDVPDFLSLANELEIQGLTKGKHTDQINQSSSNDPPGENM